MSRARRYAKPSDCWSGAASWRHGRIAAPSWLGPACRSSPIFEALRELEGLCAGFGAMPMISDERAQLARINASLLSGRAWGRSAAVSRAARVLSSGDLHRLAHHLSRQACRGTRVPASPLQPRSVPHEARSQGREHPRCHRQQRGAGGFDRHAPAHRERLRRLRRLRYWHLINRAVASRPRTPASCRSSKCPGRLLPPRPPPGSP